VIETPHEFGLGSSGKAGSSSNLEEQVLPYLQSLATFRDNIRQLIRDKKDPKEILALCDKLRDDDLPELGVRLEDREGAKSLIKLDDKATLLREKEEKKQVYRLFPLDRYKPFFFCFLLYRKKSSV